MFQNCKKFWNCLIRSKNFWNCLAVSVLQRLFIHPWVYPKENNFSCDANILLRICVTQCWEKMKLIVWIRDFFDCLNKRWGFAEEAWESADGSTWEVSKDEFCTIMYRPPLFLPQCCDIGHLSFVCFTNQCTRHQVNREPAWTTRSTPSWAPKHAILDGCSTVVRVIRALGLDGLELWVVRGVEHSDYCNRSHFDKSALSFATRALFLSLLNQSSQLSPTLQGRLSSKVKMSKGQGWIKPHLTRCHILNINILRKLLQ